MSGLIKAMDARQMSKDKSRIIAETELEDVYELIREECSNGNYEVMVEKKLSAHALKRLEELGYKCEALEYGTMVKWDD